MKKLLIGAMMASLFMVSSDADAFSLFGKKNKSTSDVSTSNTNLKRSASAPELGTSNSKSSTNLKKSASAPELGAKNLGTKKVGLFSKLMGKASQQKTENAMIYAQQMGKYFEAPVAAICIQSNGLASFFSDELSNNHYVKNSEPNKPDLNAKTNIQSAIKALQSIYKYMRKILQNQGLLTTTDAENTIGQLSEALLALVGTGEEQNKPSQFWKHFGNHIRYSLIVMRNSFNMLLYKKEYWNVGGMIFSANDGTRGEDGDKKKVQYHIGSVVYKDPEDEEISEDSPVLLLRNGLTKLVNELVTTEKEGEVERQAEKRDRKARLSRTSNMARSSRTLINEYGELADGGHEVSIDDESPATTRKSKSLGDLTSAQSAARKLRANSNTRTQDEYGSGEDIDDDNYYDAWSKYAATNDDEYDDSGAWGQ